MPLLNLYGLTEQQYLLSIDNRFSTDVYGGIWFSLYHDDQIHLLCYKKCWSVCNRLPAGQLWFEIQFTVVEGTDASEVIL